MRSPPHPANASADSPHQPVSWRMVVAIAWLAVFFAFFFTRPMPNLHATFAENRAKAVQIVPIVVLDWVLPAASDARPPGMDSGWRFLPQRLGLWSLAALILAGAWGMGEMLLRWLIGPEELTRLERLVFALGTGLSIVSLLTLGFGVIGLLHRGLFAGILIAGSLGGLGSALWSRWQRRNSEASKSIASNPSRAKWLCLLAVLPFLIAMLMGGVSPSTDFDVKEYHFGGPKEFFLAGRVEFLPHNVYTSFPFLTEMLTLLGMVLRNDWYAGALVGKSVLMAFIPLTGLAILAAGRRWFGEWAGWLGMLVWLTTPWAVRIAIIAYAEGGLACYLFLAFFATGIAIEHLKREGEAPAEPHENPTSPGKPAQRELRPPNSIQNQNRFPKAGLFVMAGLLAGSGMACKYTGLVSVVFPMAVAIGFVVFRRQRQPAELSQSQVWLRTLGAFSLGVAVTVGPWLGKNLIETGNPVYPLAWSVFGGRDWDADRNAQWTKAHSPADHRLWSLVVWDDGSPGWVIDVMAVNDWLSPLLYGLAPLVLLVPRFRRTSKPIWLFAAWLFFGWWCFTHRLDRFWVPMLPVVALLAGAGAAWSSDRLWKIAGAAAIGWALLFNFVLAATQNAGYIAWLSDLEEAGTFTARLTAPELAVLNERLKAAPKQFRILSVGDAEVFDARFPIVYNTVFDRSIFQDWTAQPAPGVPLADVPMRSPAEIREKFHQEGITHVLVNWQEILRYRPTYGYTEYVQPQRFDWLVENGVLEAPEILSRRTWQQLPAGDRAELIKSGWRELLREPSPWEESIGLSALYPVR